MPALILIIVAAVAFGAIIGWFARLRLAIYICLIAPLLPFVGDVIFQSHTGWTGEIWISTLFITIFPFYFFLAVPCVIGGVLMNRVAYRIKRHTKI
jgi:hypothetical protein